MTERVLLVEDNSGMQKIVQSAIANVCELVVAGTLSQGEQELNAHPYDLLILDVVLPDGDGFEFCKQLRTREQFQELPIIFLTGQSDVEHRVQGFSLGADDYIVKPIELKEFVARVEAKLKRKPIIKLQTTIEKASFRIDLITQRIFQKDDEGKDHDLDLTPIEFKLLVQFLNNEGKIFSRVQLLLSVWGGSIKVSNHTIDTHISTLRKKLGDSGRYLKVAVKQGYYFSFHE